jgi:hypothetical protein
MEEGTERGGVGRVEVTELKDLMLKREECWDARDDRTR